MPRLNVLSAGAVKRGVSQLAQAFAREHEAQVDVEFATAPQLRTRIEGGERPHVVVAPVQLMERFAGDGWIVPESRTGLGRSRIGVTVHAQSAVGDVGDIETFRRILAQASAIVHNSASSGIYVAALLERLGLDSKERVVIVQDGAGIMEYVAAHPDAVGLAQISEIRVLIERGVPVRLASPLPDEIQNVTTYEAAALRGVAGENAACALARFMGSAEAKSVFAATGID
jgi:molybdate transport system substrate-binding protein